MIEEILVGEQPTATGNNVLRVEPTQGRSVARLDALLDAAATIVDEVGFEHLTTAQVAERAGASIGTVYRYFPDRVALLAALRDRAVNRYRIAAATEFEQAAPSTWQETIELFTETYATMFRTQPGFRIMRYEDLQGAQDLTVEERLREFAQRLAELFVTRFGFTMSDELVFHLHVASQMGETLVEHAFLHQPGGDNRLVAEARVVARAYLESYYD